MKDDPDRYVVQGVHMIIEGDHQRAWRDGEKHESRLVFIGRDLDRDRLRRGFEGCAGLISRCRQSRLLISTAIASAAGFVGDVPHFCLADGTIHRLDHGDKVNTAHDGLLAAAFDPLAARLVTSGEDGTVRESRADGALATLAEIGRKWITAVACGPQGAVAFASGRTACVRFADGTIKEFAHPRSVEGIAFAPKGMRIGVARYNGATLHFPGRRGQAARAAMGWRPHRHHLLARRQLRRHGHAGECPARLEARRRQAHAHDRLPGQGEVSVMERQAASWLASSGAPAAIVWPFTGKDGPMGKAPLELGTRGNTMVTASPAIRRMTSSPSAMPTAWCSRPVSPTARRCCCAARGKGAITGLGWDREGRRAAFGAETGECGVIDISA